MCVGSAGQGSQGSAGQDTSHAPTCTKGTRARTSLSDTWTSQTSLSFWASGSCPGYSTCQVRGRTGARPPVPFSTTTSRSRNAAKSVTLSHQMRVRAALCPPSHPMAILGWALGNALRPLLCLGHTGMGVGQSTGPFEPYWDESGAWHRFPGPQGKACSDWVILG